MKKKLILLTVSLIVSALALSACNCTDGGFSATPEDEYKRVYSFAGEGVTFDFDEHKTFSASASGTFSGGNLKSDIAMSSLYTHDYRKKSGEPKKSYASMNNVNSVSVTGAGVEPFLEHKETGFQYIEVESEHSYRGWYYLESYKSGGTWSFPTVSGNGDYDDLIATDPTSSDALVRYGSRLLDPEYLENFDGAKASGRFVVGADVKSDKIAEFAEWLDKFFPLFALKDSMNTDREWKFFDLSGAAENYRGRIEIRTTAAGLTDVAVTFETLTHDFTGMGKITFRARQSFKSGGVSVKRLSYFG